MNKQAKVFIPLSEKLGPVRLTQSGGTKRKRATSFPEMSDTRFTVVGLVSDHHPEYLLAIQRNIATNEDGFSTDEEVKRWNELQENYFDALHNLETRQEQGTIFVESVDADKLDDFISEEGITHVVKTKFEDMDRVRGMRELECLILGLKDYGHMISQEHRRLRSLDDTKSRIGMSGVAASLWYDRFE